MGRHPGYHFNFVPAGLIALIDSQGIALAEGASEVRTTDKPAVEMQDAPTISAAAPTAANLVSLWQTNSVAVLSEREVNWVKVRSGAVSIISNAYGY